MKKIFVALVLFVVFCNSRVWATSQGQDVVIWGKDTLFAYLNLPDEFYVEENRTTIIFGHETNISTACYDGFLAEWRIEDSQLYLTKIYDCEYKEMADLKRLFREKYIEGKVRADWISDTILAGKGSLVSWFDDFLPIYPKQIELIIFNGLIISQKAYDNSRSKESEYCINGEKLKQFIYTNVNWSLFPDLKNVHRRVYVRFLGNIEGKIDSATILRGYEDIYNNEAIRVIKSIPQWEVFLNKGELIRRPWTVPVEFSEEKKKQYVPHKSKK